MNIFVTGATGFIGSVFLKTLFPRLKSGDKVFVLVRSGQQYGDKRLVQLAGTLETLHNFKENILMSDYFFHIAAESRLVGGKNYAKINFESTRDIIDILKEGKYLKKIIYVSSIAAVSRGKADKCALPISSISKPYPAAEYGCSKLNAERYIKGSGLPFVIIRPSFVYGKNMREESHINKFVSMVYRRNPFIFLKFPGKISIIHVDDLATALVNCIYSDISTGKIYFAQTETSTLGDIFRIIYETMYQRRLKQISVPRFHHILGKIHTLIPAVIAIPFLDYWWAQDENFCKDLLNGITVKKINDSITDVISTNAEVNKHLKH